MNQTELTPQPMKQPAVHEVTQGLEPNNGFDNKANLLSSWKEIASYLDRTVRTVQRWERQEQLPVHRHQHQRGLTVYAFKHEIDDWFSHRARRPADFSRLAIANHSYAVAIVHLQRFLNEAGLAGPVTVGRKARTQRAGRKSAPSRACLRLEAVPGNLASRRSLH